MKKNTINWFEIPVADIKRATSFYEQLLATPLKTETFGPPGKGSPMTVLKSDGGVSGALVQVNERKPSNDGALIYLNVDGELDTVLGRVSKAGGQVVTPRTEIGQNGSYAVFRDTEGNHVGLHQS
ncbi:MAG: VOC family protein [Archangium sp.]|nr:VOC family protein [Archangium sp.]